MKVLRIGGLLVALAAAAYAVVLLFIGPLIDGRMNAVQQPSPYELPGVDALPSRAFFIADLHADPLLWRRDLLEHHDFGQVDLPRMQTGLMGLQVFGVVTKTPRNMNYDANSAESDNITTLAVLQAWPPATWFSLRERALYQARRLNGFIDASGGAMQWVTTPARLADWQQARTGGRPVVGALLGLEGAHALEGDLDNLEQFYAAGFRMIGLAHFFDNEFAGSAHGMDKHGLTNLGRELVARAQALGMLVDLAHASPATIKDVFEISGGPLVASHTGVRGTCDRQRNLSDPQLRGIAASGGLVAIAMFPEAVCGKDLAATARAMRYAADTVGIEHVALGADFDGTVTTPVDVSGVPLLVEAMRAEGFSDDAIADILGRNFERLLSRVLQ